MELNERELLKKAQENANWMFRAEEIAVLCDLTPDIVERIKAEPDGPFFMDKCRPEWLVEWMRRHAGFGAAEGTSSGDVKRSPASPGPNPWAEARRPPREGKNQGWSR